MTDHDDRNPSGTWQADEASSMSRTSSTATGYGGPSERSASSSTAEQGGRMRDDLKRDAADLAHSAKEQGRSMFEQQKHTVAQQVESVGTAFRTAASELQGEGESQAGRYVATLAEKLESLGEQLRHKNMDGLVREAESFGRRAPAAFFAGALAAGFMLTRFMKSSAHRPHEAGSMSHRDTGSRSWQEDPVSGPMSASSRAAASAAASPMGSSMAGSSSGFGTTDHTLGTGVAGDGAPLRASDEGPSVYTEPRWGETTTASSGVSDADAASSTSTRINQPGGNIHGNR